MTHTEVSFNFTNGPAERRNAAAKLQRSKNRTFRRGHHENHKTSTDVKWFPEVRDHRERNERSSIFASSKELQELKRRQGGLGTGPTEEALRHS